ncbi:hypothetical protein [Streptomyces sp. NPDC006012]|uniref:hypothetical protein n=1 Tax=Streptomyces sp. NPDC006012 TaxID=3364739 RepID=UPI0036B17018
MTVRVRTTVLTWPEAVPLPTGRAEAACGAGAVTRAQADGWTAGRRRAETGRVFLTVPMFVAAATAPR